MAKFYVQSGSIQAVIDSVDIDRAALWVVHRVMNSTLPLDGIDDSRLVTDVTEETGQHLGHTIRISELGFDREDAAVIDTLETFRHWYELYQAISILADRW